ncbi:hypothetical protein GGS20DRAFT_31378 [Poronia punctata]|nr:hypothetical protein GGS20DRAFT_31378 [Poronia punctata]
MEFPCASTSLELGRIRKTTSRQEVALITGDPLLRQEPDILGLAQKLHVEDKAGPLTIGGMQSHAFVHVHGRNIRQLRARGPVPRDSRRDSRNPKRAHAWLIIHIPRSQNKPHGRSFVGEPTLLPS